MPSLLGRKLTHLRQSAVPTLSQAALARHLNLSRHFINNIEAGRKLPRVDLVARLGLFFHIQTDWFIRDDLSVADHEQYSLTMSPDTTIMQFFPQKLRYQRELRQWTQLVTAQRLGDVSRVHISYLETGEKSPSIHLLERMVLVFGLTADYWLFDAVSVTA